LDVCFVPTGSYTVVMVNDQRVLQQRLIIAR
jgi:hypothetical protein